MSIAAEPLIDKLLSGIENDLYRNWLKNNIMFAIDQGIAHAGGDLSEFAPEIRKTGEALILLADALEAG